MKKLLSLLTQETTSAVMIDETDENNIILGFCLETTTSFDDPTWLLKKISKKDGITMIAFANGQRAYHAKWSKRNDYDYKITSNFENYE